MWTNVLKIVTDVMRMLNVITQKEIILVPVIRDTLEMGIRAVVSTGPGPKHMI